MDIKHYINDLSSKHFVSRIFCAWIFVSFCNSLTDINHLSLEFSGSICLPVYLLCVLLCVVALSIIDYYVPTHLDEPLLFIVSILYSFRIVFCSHDVYLLAGVCLVQFFVLYFCYDEIKHFFKIAFPSKLCIPCHILIISIICGFILVATICRYQICSSSTFDMGIFSQMFYNMKSHFSMITTCERYTALSHLKVHTSLFFYCLLPLYFIFPYTQTLLVFQVVAVGFGFIAVILLCKHFGFSKKCTVLFSIIYGFSPATIGGCFYDFHENIFLIPLLLFLFYCYEKKYMKRMILLAVLVCTVKEDATLFIIVFGLYLLLSRKDVKPALFCITLGTIAMITALSYLSAQGTGIMTNHYNNLVPEQHPGLYGIFSTLLDNPGYLFTQMTDKDKIPFLLTIFLPMTILPFATKKCSRFILCIPFIFINVLPSYKFQHSIYYQYICAPYMFLLYLCILNAKELHCKKLHFVLMLCSCFAITAFVSQLSVKTSYLHQYATTSSNQEKLQSAFDSIPQTASVCASTFFVPHLAKRDEIYLLYNLDIIKQYPEYQTDYVMFDLRPQSNTDNLLKQITYYEKIGYTDVSEKTGLYLIMKKQTITK